MCTMYKQEPSEAQDGMALSATRVTSGCEEPNRSGGTESRCMKEQQALLAAEPFLQASSDQIVKLRSHV